MFLDIVKNKEITKDYCHRNGILFKLQLTKLIACLTHLTKQH